LEEIFREGLFRTFCEYLALIDDFNHSQKVRGDVRKKCKEIYFIFSIVGYNIGILLFLADIDLLLEGTCIFASLALFLLILFASLVMDFFVGTSTTFR
jgi:hypothetical protein